MTTLDPAAGYLVLINTFSVDPARATELTEVLSRATQDFMCKKPGFVSANLHVSHDRRHVANYAQWRSKADLDAMMKDPGAQVHMREAAGIATSFSPIYYDLCEIHSAATTP